SGQAIAGEEDALRLAGAAVARVIHVVEAFRVGGAVRGPRESGRSDRHGRCLSSLRGPAGAVGLILQVSSVGTARAASEMELKLGRVYRIELCSGELRC